MSSTADKQPNKKQKKSFTCIHCNNNYSRKENFDGHFSNEYVKKPGIGLVKNICYNARARRFGTSAGEVAALREQPSMDKFLKKSTSTVTEENDPSPTESQENQPPAPTPPPVTLTETSTSTEVLNELLKNQQTIIGLLCPRPPDPQSDKPRKRKIDENMATDNIQALKDNLQKSSSIKFILSHRLGNVNSFNF
jgi:hypothetical protein